MPEHWRHQFIHIHSKGRVKVCCTPCAVSSPWFTEPDDADRLKSWTVKHGLREKKTHSIDK